MELSYLLDESEKRINVPAHVLAQGRQHDQWQASLDRDSRWSFEFEEGVGVVHAVKKQQQRWGCVGLTVWSLGGSTLLERRVADPYGMIASQVGRLPPCSHGRPTDRRSAASNSADRTRPYRLSMPPDGNPGQLERAVGGPSATACWAAGALALELEPATRDPEVFGCRVWNELLERTRSHGRVHGAWSGARLDQVCAEASITFSG